MTFVLILIAMMVAVLVFMNIWTRRLTRQGRKAVPQPGQIAPVRGGTIHYVEKGDPAAQTIVMIHGLAGQLQHFTYALVDKLAEDFHVIAIDRPGCGYSTRDSAKSGELPVQARMIDEFLQSKGVTQTVLVGHSLGGAVSLAMALHQPDRVAALALLAPLTHSLPETPAVFKPLEIRTGWLRNLIGHTLAVPIAAKTAPYTLTAVFEPEPAPDDFLDRADGRPWTAPVRLYHRLAGCCGRRGQHPGAMRPILRLAHTRRHPVWRRGRDTVARPSRITNGRIWAEYRDAGEGRSYAADNSTGDLRKLHTPYRARCAH
ncbi:MAG: alpha/beta fold hydrolase, partial [Pseudomonadota bacterium]